MNTLVVYDSIYGFTEKVAKAIGSEITGDVKVARVIEVKTIDVAKTDLLIIGSPTQAGKMLKSVQDWLDTLTETAVKDKKVAVFDTRIPAKWVKLFGFAADKMAAILKKKGANLIRDPEAFFVKGGKGPLVEGEEQRAVAWGQSFNIQ